MDSLHSKAFMLGSWLHAISIVKGSGGALDGDNAKGLKRMVEGLARALNLGIDDIPGVATGDDFARLRDAVRSDLQAIQSYFVSQCFAFGYDFSGWVSYRGGYGEQAQNPAYREMAEGLLRHEAADIGLLAEWEEALAAARNPALSREVFANRIGVDMLAQMDMKLDLVDPKRPRAAQPRQGKNLFIVMPMLETDAHLVDVLDTIQKTAAALGLEANRVDQLEESGRITDSIVDGLKRAAYVVVDLTHTRPNVYWEAGFTHGLGKIPIYIAREGTSPEFDVKDYPVIYFLNNKTLGEKLSQRLRNLMQGQKEQPFFGVDAARKPT